MTPDNGASDNRRGYLTEHPRPHGCVIAHPCRECGAERGEPCRGIEAAVQAIDDILKREVADGVLGKSDRRRLRYCMGAAIRKALGIDAR